MPTIVPDPTDTAKVPRRAVRVLVTGSRDWTDQTIIYRALDTLGRAIDASGRDLVIVHGACSIGVDYWAQRWALENLSNRVHNEPHPADWKTYKTKAGFIRNAAMARLSADLCLAFIHNDSNGATHCSRPAVGNDIPTIVFRQTYPDLSQIAAALAVERGE